MGRYVEIKQEQFDFKAHGGFFAFGQDQFTTNKIGEEPFVSMGAGLYCSETNAPTLAEAFHKFVDEKNEQIKKECTPQEVFDYEYNNYECDYTNDVENPCMYIIELYGMDTLKKMAKANNRKARQIKNFLAYEYREKKEKRN